MRRRRTPHPLIQQLARARTQRGITQKDLASRALITGQSLTGWETGAHDPRLSSISDIADALGYDIVLAPKRRWLR